MRLADLAGRRVAVWGPGAEGLALAEAATRAAPPRSVQFLSDEPGEVGPEAAARIAALDAPLVTPAEADWGRVDVLVRTAGVSRYRNELRDVAAAGVAQTTPTALWFADHQDRRVVAVTGTKGKSTTAALIQHLVTGVGERAALAGNIGAPLADLYGRDDPGLRIVAEVSSYQAADLAHGPEVATVTNLAPDHLPWHSGDVEVYYRDKLNLLAHRRDMVSVLNAGDAELRLRAVGAPHPVWFCGEDGYRVEGASVIGPSGVIVDAAALQLAGRFNLENCCAALATVAAWGLPVDRETAGELLAGFVPLPGRFQLVGRVGGVDFVADALASNPTGAAAAVRALGARPLTLIVGGADRSIGFGELAEAIRGRADPVALVALPDNGAAVAAAVGPPSAPVVVCTEVAEAVAAAAELTPVDGVVLFAPAAPTPRRLGTYADRTEAFRRAVSALPAAR